MFQEVQLHTIVQWHVDMKDTVELLHSEIELVLGTPELMGMTLMQTNIIEEHQLPFCSSILVLQAHSCDTQKKSHTQITDVNS